MALEPLDLDAPSTYNDRVQAAKINELVLSVNRIIEILVLGEQDTKTETEKETNE